jgi:hypothetical protein
VKLDDGDFTYDIDRSMGPVTVEVKLTRSNSHKGASEFSSVRQVAHVSTDVGWKDLDFERRQTETTVHEWFLNSGHPAETWSGFALFGRSIASEKNKLRGTSLDEPEDPNLDKYLRIMLADIILERSGPSLHPADRLSLENAIRLVAAEIRLELPHIKQRISDLRQFATVLDTGDIDIAIASLFTDDSVAAKALNEAIDRMKQWRRILSDEERDSLTAFIDHNLATGPIADTIVALAELKSTLLNSRKQLWSELIELVIERARLEADCEGVKEESSRVLGQIVTLSGAFGCK